MWKHPSRLRLEQRSMCRLACWMRTADVATERGRREHETEPRASEREQPAAPCWVFRSSCQGSTPWRPARLHLQLAWGSCAICRSTCRQRWRSHRRWQSCGPPCTYASTATRRSPTFPNQRRRLAGGQRHIRGTSGKRVSPPWSGIASKTWSGTFGDWDKRENIWHFLTGFSHQRDVEMSVDGLWFTLEVLSYWQRYFYRVTRSMYRTKKWKNGLIKYN